MSQPLIVTAAILRKKGQILITRRPQGTRDAGMWEFPGGKLDAGETPEECLRRELMEELGLPIEVGNIFQVVHHRYDWGAVLLLFYECLPLADRIENLQVAEHTFALPSELVQFDFLAADRPVVKNLVKQDSAK